MNYSELLQLAKGWGNFISGRIIIWRLLYSGDICYLSACEEQKYFFADKNQNLEMWNDICLGEFEVINVPGNHVTCIHSEENATLLAQIIIERNIRG